MDSKQHGNTKQQWDDDALQFSDFYGSNLGWYQWHWGTHNGTEYDKPDHDFCAASTDWLGRTCNETGGCGWSCGRCVAADPTPANKLERDCAPGQCTAPKTECDTKSVQEEVESRSVLRRKATLYKGIYVDGKVEDVKLKFTADTGATVTILSERVFKQIPSDKRPQLNGSSMLKDVSGYPVTEHGAANVRLELGPFKLTQTIVVADIEDDALLGDDVMIEHPDGPADLILSQRTIVLGGYEIPCQIVGKIARRAVAADHYIIPGHSEVSVDVYVEESRGDSRSVQEGSQAMEENSHVRCDDTPVAESDYSVDEFGTGTRPLIESDDQGADLSGDLGNGPQRTSRVKEGVAVINDEALECAVFEPCQDFVKKHNLLVAASLLNARDNVTVKVRLLNPFEQEVSVKQDTRLETREPVHLDNVYPLCEYEDESEIKKTVMTKGPLNWQCLNLQISQTM